MLAVTLATALLLQGYTHHMFGITSDSVTGVRGSTDMVPSQVLRGGPVIANAATTAHTAQVKPRTTALTFDDGPDPVWTPRILDGCAATMCTRPSSSSEPRPWPTPNWYAGSSQGPPDRHPHLHPSRPGSPCPLATLPGTARDTAAVAGAAGVTTALLRPPYSSRNDALDNTDWSVLQQADTAGYVTVLATQDARGLAASGCGPDPHPCTPHGRTGQIVLMHDAGGDRSQTVAALSILLPRSRHRATRSRRSPMRSV